MPKGENKGKTTVWELLELTCKPEEQKKTFEDIVPAVWEEFGLDGTPDRKAFERLLINVVLSQYNEDEKMDARKRDASLLMLGLLDGYYYQDEKDGKKLNDTLPKRYQRYLENSDFVKIIYPGEGTYEEIAAKDKKRRPQKQPRPLNCLTKTNSKCKEEICQSLEQLLKNGNYKTYMSADGEKAENGHQTVLPKPCYTLERFPPLSEEEPLQGSETEPEVHPANQDSAKKIPGRFVHELKRWMTWKDIALILAVIIVCILLGRVLSRPAEQQADTNSFSEMPTGSLDDAGTSPEMIVVEMHGSGTVTFFDAYSVTVSTLSGASDDGTIDVKVTYIIADPDNLGKVSP